MLLPRRPLFPESTNEGGLQPKTTLPLLLRRLVGLFVWPLLSRFLPLAPPHRPQSRQHLVRGNRQDRDPNSHGVKYPVGDGAGVVLDQDWFHHRGVGGSGAIEFITPARITL